MKSGSHSGSLADFYERPMSVDEKREVREAAERWERVTAEWNALTAQAHTLRFEDRFKTQRLCGYTECGKSFYVDPYRRGRPQMYCTPTCTSMEHLRRCRERKRVAQQSGDVQAAAHE